MRYWITDSFTDGSFTGAQTLVAFLKAWPTDEMLHKMAMEIPMDCCSFLIPREDGYDLRWFSENGEEGNMKYTFLGISAVLEKLGKGQDVISFHTKNGLFQAKREGERYIIDLGAIPVEPYPLRQDMVDALGGAVPAEVYKGRDLLFVFEKQEDVAKIVPDFEKLKALPEGIGTFVSAPGNNEDVVSRAFWPKININEDTVCGSMQCCIAPLYGKKLGKKTVISRQLSHRGGLLELELREDRVIMRGDVCISAEGTFLYPELEPFAGM
ncbi:MAG: PhzF family phenazine biosynthesis protein [Clostridia bacterium]|nr:PhzF family phenazine biosynthesis protein [Clostridia bacterium]